MRMIHLLLVDVILVLLDGGVALELTGGRWSEYALILLLVCFIANRSRMHELVHYENFECQ